MELGVRVSSKNSVVCLSFLASFLLGALLSPAPTHAQSQNCVLLAHVDSLPGSGSSCWGYVDPNTGKEYAIFGNQNGTAIYNLDTPSDPRLTGFIPGPSSSWREMKTYSTYCYVGTEAGGGMQIINLSNPEAPFLQTTYEGSGLSTIHTVTVDSVTAKLYANGANGGCRIISLANPIAPVEIGNYTAFYVHDSHVRQDTLYAACLSNGLRILNVSNPALITEISSFQTENDFVHNAWTSEDRQYLFVTDEVSGGRVTSWDISTLTSPIQVDGFTADATGDAHNVHVNGNIAYVAHYTSGLRVLDVSDPTNLTEVGFYDTYPSPGGLFNGAWGLYCWFPSGVIVVSDIEGGMFLFDYIVNPAYVRGTVIDATTTLPISNARVRFPLGGADSTDALGNYLLLNEAGTYDIQASAYGYVTQSVNQTLTLGDTVVVNIALAPIPSGSVSGVFRYPQGAGIPNAPVSIRGTPLATTTDVNGAYSFPQVPEGTYTIALDFWTCLPESAQVTVSSSLANSEVNFTFEGVAFAFNMEDTSSAGWAVNVGGGDNAGTGIWTRVNPNGTAGGTVQPENDHTPGNPPAKCWVTGQGTVGGSIGEQDVDGGRTTLYSATMDMSSLADPKIQYFRWYTNNSGGDPNNDVWKAQISSNGGTTWVTTDSTKVTDASWREVRVRVADYVTPSSQVRMRFIAEDAGAGSIVEAAVDDFRVWGLSVVAVEGGLGSGPLRFALHPNSPNPFNPRTEIRFDLPATADTRLEVYSPEGRLVRTLGSGRLLAGRHAVAWDGRNEADRAVASGIYLLRLEAGEDQASRKIMLAK